MIAYQNCSGHMSQEIKESIRCLLYKSRSQSLRLGFAKVRATNAKLNVVNAGVIAGQVKFIFHVQEEYRETVKPSTENGSKVPRIKSQR